jgi:hypothetical protein
MGVRWSGGQGDVFGKLFSPLSKATAAETKLRTCQPWPLLLRLKVVLAVTD